MPNQVILRDNVEATKVCMVLDAFSTEGKRGTTLKKCLHVGLNVMPFLLVEHLAYKVMGCEFESRSGQLFSRTFSFHFSRLLLLYTHFSLV